MAQLRQDYQKFVERDAEIIAIGPEDFESFRRWWLNEKMPFTGIPDHQHIIAKLYGQKVNLLKGGRLPSLAVIDKKGQIRFMHYANLPSDIPPDDKILSLLDGLNKEPP